MELFLEVSPYVGDPLDCAFSIMHIVIQSIFFARFHLGYFILGSPAQFPEALNDVPNIHQLCNEGEEQAQYAFDTYHIARHVLDHVCFLIFPTNAGDYEKRDLQVRLQGKLEEHDKLNAVQLNPGKLLELLARPQLPALRQWLKALAVALVDLVALLGVDDGLNHVLGVGERH